MIFALPAAVSFHNAFALREEGIRAIDSADTEIVMDFAQAEQIDSSAAALMLDWLRHAKLHDKSLSCINLSDSLQAILNIGGVRDFFV